MNKTLTIVGVATGLLFLGAWEAPTTAQQCEDPSWEYPACPSPHTPAGHPPGICLPYPQPHVAAAEVETTCEKGKCTSSISTGEGIFPPCNPFDQATFPGNNFLPNVWQNLHDFYGREMANTLPSDPEIPFRLHGAPEVSLINPTSPTDDLEDVLRRVRSMTEEILGLGHTESGGNKEFDQNQAAFLAAEIPRILRRGLDILEGMPVPNRAYSGIPVLHYMSPEKIATPDLTYDGDGNVIAANVDVHQIWYDQHIESDVAYIDITDVASCNPLDPVHPCEWTVTYHVDVLNGGHDDFSPFTIFFDRNMVTDKEDGPPKPHAGMDQTFFNMEEGTRSVFGVRMPPAGYMNLIYTWGWRQHPPRIQVIENALKKITYSDSHPHVGCPAAYDGKTLTEIEQMVFCRPRAGQPTACDQVRCAPGQRRWDANGEPTECEKDMLYAIGKLGDVAPAKRMWKDFLASLELAGAGNYEGLLEVIGSPASPPNGTWAAFFAWQDRTKLPCYEWDRDGNCTDGVSPDPDSDLTILYANNTIYGQLTQVFDGYTDYSDPQDPQPIEQVIRAGWVRWDEWKLRPQLLEVTALNGDHFVHSYFNVDFGGSRGWENLFKSSVRLAGSGCWFTFGRASWHINQAPSVICVPEAQSHGTPGQHQIGITYNYEPSRRLRFYQFDQFHHDVNIYSIH